MEYQKNSCCGYCGKLFLEQVKWPRKCFHCQNESYSNPLPVSVSFVDAWTMYNGAMLIGTIIQKRNINPKKGQWALNSGYINAYEKWQEGAVRELKEELGLTIPVEEVKLYDLVDDQTNHLLIFNYVERPVYLGDIKFVPNEEVLEIKVIYHPIELAFPNHTKMLGRYLKERSYGI